MELSIDIRTLIWLFPIIFVLHDFEEIIMMEKWLTKNSNILFKKLPKKVANRVMKQFSMTTAQFSVAVLIVFLFVSSSTFMANQYIIQSSFANIYFFTILLIIFFVHVFTHIGQSIILRSITPGVITSVIFVLPYCLIVFKVLFENQIITWDTILFCLPFTVLIIPIVLLAHWIGKRAV